jgi:hypothetical protein
MIAKAGLLTVYSALFSSRYTNVPGVLPSLTIFGIELALLFATAHALGRPINMEALI